jgi:hypothetical protein
MPNARVLQYLRVIRETGYKKTEFDKISLRINAKTTGFCTYVKIRSFF